MVIHGSAAQRVAVGLSVLLCAASLAVGAAKPDAPAIKPARKMPPKAATYNISQVGLINDQVRQSWSSHELVPSGPANDGEWCRRVYLDVLGRIPTITELNKFTGNKSTDRKAQLVGQLLGDEYVEEYAKNWTTLWTNILIGRAGGTERRTLISRSGLQQALRRAFTRNMTYDRLVYNLVSAEGVSKPGEKDFNGFVNFLAGNLKENAVEATARTSQYFLGLQVRCTQCHNHPFNEWKQNQFWELNAFFRQTQIKQTQGGRKKRDIDHVELVNRDFSGEDKRPDEAVLFYELRNGKMAAALPVFVDGTKLKSDSGYVSQVDRRKELATLIVNSEQLGKAIVNRMWGHFLGYGFTKPIDDMGPHNPPTHPELLDSLAQQFKTRSYDLKELIRWITLSEPYSLSSRREGNERDDPALGERPMFSHFYLRQMRTEELYESLLVATEAQKAQGKQDEQEAAKRKWLSQFTLTFGTDENDETTTFNGTIPQALMMMNGELVRQAMNVDKGSFLHRIATDPKLSNADRIHYLYRTALSRRPTSTEVSLANQLLAARRGNAPAAMQDIWWAVLNSSEFILNH